jgi:hypothetical protein
MPIQNERGDKGGEMKFDGKERECGKRRLIGRGAELQETERTVGRFLFWNLFQTGKFHRFAAVPFLAHRVLCTVSSSDSGRSQIDFRP